MFRYRFRTEYYYILLNLKKKRRRFWVRPTLRRGTSHGVEHLIRDICEDDIGLSGEIRSSLPIVYECLAKILKVCYN